MNKHLLGVALLATIAIPTFGAERQAVSDSRPGMRTENAFRFMPKAKAESQKAHSLFAGTNQRLRNIAGAPDKALPTGDTMGYLDAPGGEVWYYVGQFEKNEDGYITSYTFTVYDGNFEEVTKVSDITSLAENETGIRDVQLGSLVTSRFFNYDSSDYEFMVAIAANTKEYVNHYYTKIYTSNESQTGAIDTFEGYFSDYVNVATDSFSENYYIVFSYEDEAETPEIGGVMNTFDYVLKVYKKASYSGGPSEVTTLRIPGLLACGENYVPIVSTAHDGKAYFAVNYLKYSYYEDPLDWNNENLTPDNKFIIDLKEIDGWGNLTNKSHTEIPVEATTNNMNFYCLGFFRYDEDVNFDRYTDDGTPAYVVTISNYKADKDNYTYTYKVYDTEGAELLTLGEGIESTVFMSDVRGYNPQAMFIKSDNDRYTFDFVDIVTGHIDNSIPYEVAEDVVMNEGTDRIADGDSYIYVVSQYNAYVEENGDTWHRIAYIKPDGTVDHVDKINIGKDVAYAQTYNNADGFNPYLFDTDDNREYMVLVKHYLNYNTSETEELFFVVSPEKGVLFTLGPDENLGKLASISLDASESQPKLVVVYDNYYRYTTVAYDLPFVSFSAGGDGTAENPYKISTIGDFSCIGRNLAANYEIVNDIDAGGMEMSPVAGAFAGVLDGKGYNISNLKLYGNGLFEAVQSDMPGEAGSKGGEVKNLNIIRPYMSVESDGGILSETSIGAKFSDVRIYDAEVEGEGDVTFGGILGTASNGTVISGCALENADINLPEASAIGGIAGETRTGSKVSASAFSGKIVGGTSVGGIVGNLGNVDDRVADCHVNADITAKNTIGGIAGNSSRGVIERCHVEGRLEATEYPQWGNGLALGGVVGNLDADWESINGGSEGGSAPVVTGCFVNLTELKAVETEEVPEWEGQYNSIHRIAGGTVANESPDPIYDDNWNVIGYGDPFEETGLANNYAIVTLAKVQDSVEDALTTTEGKSIESNNLGKEFFEGLGYQFGTDTAKPWNEEFPSAPALFFEGGLPAFEIADLSVEVDSEGILPLIIAGVKMSDENLDAIDVTIGNTAILSLVSVVPSESGAVITVKGLAEGNTQVTAEFNGRSVVANVTVKKAVSGIVDAVAENQAITFDGNTVRAEGCAIEVYSITGVKMASGVDSCDLSQLERGIYVVAANDGSRRNTQKICLE